VSGAWLGLIAGALVLGTGVLWFRRVAQVRIPVDRTAFVASMACGAALGVVALTQSPGLVGGIAAGFAALGGGMFVGLRLLSRQEAREPAITLGGPMLDFTAVDDAGKPFDMSSLRGTPYLFKLFRGHW
jgi:hypothetical protein